MSLSEQPPLKCLFVHHKLQDAEVPLWAPWQGLLGDLGRKQALTAPPPAGLPFCQEQIANPCIVPAKEKDLSGPAGCCGPRTPALVQYSSLEAAFKLSWGKWSEGRARPFWVYWVCTINALEYSLPFKSYSSESPPADDCKLFLPALKPTEPRPSRGASLETC